MKERCPTIENINNYYIRLKHTHSGGILRHYYLLKKYLHSKCLDRSFSLWTMAISETFLEGNYLYLGLALRRRSSLGRRRRWWWTRQRSGSDRWPWTAGESTTVKQATIRIVAAQHTNRYKVHYFWLSPNRNKPTVISKCNYLPWLSVPNSLIFGQLICDANYLSYFNNL